MDTLEEIAVSANTVLERNGYPTHEVGSYRYFVGDGVQRLIKRVLPATATDDALVRELVTELESEYDKRANRLTQIYPGILEMLDTITKRGIRLAVLSNKPHSLTEECIRRFFPNRAFEVVLGQQAHRPRKPDPAGAIEVARQLGISTEEVLYVGDTDVDMKTAKAAKMTAVGVLWGFRQRDELINNGADHIVQSPSDLAKLL